MFGGDVRKNAEIYYEPTFTIPDGYELSDQITQPAQKVQVGEAFLHTPQLTSTGVGAESLSFEGTVNADKVFLFPLSGDSGTNPTNHTYGKPYNWSISW